MTEHQRKKIEQLGNSVCGLRLNTVATLLGIVISTGVLVGWVIIPIKRVINKFDMIDKMAYEVSELKMMGSKPLQEMTKRLDIVCGKVQELAEKGSEPLRERIIRLETAIQGFQPTLERIERKIDRHAVSDDKYGAITKPSQLKPDSIEKR